MKIAIDIGYGVTKSVNENNERKSFPSYVELMGNVPKTSSLGLGKNYTVMIKQGMETQYCYVGEAGMDRGRQWLGDMVLENPNYIPCLLTAIHNICGNEENIDLAIGFPYSTFEIQKNEVTKFLIGKTFFVTVNGTEKKITIQSCFPLAQGIGVYFGEIYHIDGTLKNNKIKSMSVGIVDIGTRTTDILFTETDSAGKSLPVHRLCRSIDKGFQSVFEDVCDKIKEEMPRAIDVSVSDIQRILILEKGGKKGVFKYEGNAINISAMYEESKEKFANIIHGDIGNKWKDKTSNLDLLVVAGGAGEEMFLYLEALFKNTVQTCRATDPLYANCEGFLSAQTRNFLRLEKLIKSKE